MNFALDILLLMVTLIFGFVCVTITFGRYSLPCFFGCGLNFPPLGLSPLTHWPLVSHPPSTLPFRMIIKTYGERLPRTVVIDIRIVQ